MAKILLLASQSEGRKAVLQQLNIKFDTMVSNVSEYSPSDNNIKLEDARSLTAKNSHKKITHILKKKFKDRNIWDKYVVLLTADTIVWLNGHILGKPSSKKEAEIMLNSLAGKEHICITTCSLAYFDYKMKKLIMTSFTDSSKLQMTSNQEIINFYLNELKEWKGRAGAYAIQGVGSILIESLEGSYTNVMGLPLEKIISYLIKNNIQIINQLN
ncbi:MAG: nucleoside triphosphate pyrophosphatase [Candidatus Hodarchaeales archaeon]|jgi:septum formation protein